MDTESQLRKARPWPAFARLVYVLLLAIVLFATKRPKALIALLALQLILWLATRLPLAALWRAVWRLRIFYLFIFLSYAFLSTGGEGRDEWFEFAIGGWTPAINLGGLELAALMCTRVVILVLASGWMQRSSAPGELVGALRMLRFPETLAVTVDATLALVGGDDRKGSGKGAGTGKGAGEGKNRTKSSLSWQAVRRGELGSVGDMFERSLLRANEHLRARYPDLGERALHDMTVVLAVSLAVIGLKVFQIFPGLPIASGHKNIVIVPLLLFAASATHSRFGGLLAGSAVGIVSFLLGYGKYGIFEIAHFAVPGLMADLLMPVLRATSRTGRLFQYAVAGLLLGVGRFTANLLVILLAGAPLPAFLLFAPMLASQMIFGTLSCFASIMVVKAYASPGKSQENSDDST